MERLRLISQHFFALLANAYWYFPFKGPIYQGLGKYVCLPGLNCYSCPAAVTACPLGALQNFLATIRFNMAAGSARPGFYVFGILSLVGSFIGRMPCGWLCPFGLIQDWLFKLPGPKFRIWRWLRYMPYFFLLVFVILLPLFALDQAGFGMTWFCKFVCPAGTLEGGIPLLLMEKGLRRAAGWLFVHKLVVLVLLLIWSVLASRPFCRTICPLGAIFGLFNRVSWLQLKFEVNRCLQCRACNTICPTDVSFFDGTDDINSPACIRCMRCVSACPGASVRLEFAPYLKVSGEECQSDGCKKDNTCHAQQG